MPDSGPNISTLSVRGRPSRASLVSSDPSSSFGGASKSPPDAPYFSSAIDPTRRVRLRRKASESSRCTSDDDRDADYSWLDSHSHHSYSRSHIRSWTESSTGAHHPLQSTTVGRSFPDAGVTRPHLSRILDWPTHGRKLSDAKYDDIPVRRNASEETEVLVHEVLSTDSLAGVALKYGINLTDLRKANQLWASDSIHLRKVLYIPLARMFGPIAADLKALARRQAEETSEDSDHDSATITTPSDSVKSAPSIIRRIPVSQLSFFPPPSTSSFVSNSKLAGDSDTYLTEALPIFSNHHARASTAPSSFSNLLAALPISASTRDTIIARLSFDSSRSSTSDDQEHELDIVRESDQDPFTTPRATQHMPDQLPFSVDIRTPSPQRPRRHRTSSAGQLSHNPIRTSVVAGQPLAIQRPATIRTIQMEPSPAMQLPIIRAKSLRASDSS